MQEDEAALVKAIESGDTDLGKPDERGGGRLCVLTCYLDLLLFVMCPLGSVFGHLPLETKTSFGWILPNDQQQALGV